MCEPVSNMFTLGAKGPSTITLFSEITISRFYLDGNKLALNSIVIDNLDLGINAIVADSLFTENPPEIYVKKRLTVSHTLPFNAMSIRPAHLILYFAKSTND